MKRVGLLIFMSLMYNILFGLTGQEVLDRVETSLTGYSDQSAVCEVILGEKDKTKETRTMKIWSAGKSKRVVKFLSPATVKDIGILVLSDNEMYIYLPAYKKVRRIQGSMRDQNFQGTDFSYREIGSYEYSKDYVSKVLSEDEKLIILELSKREKADVPYTKIVMQVDKENYLPKKLEMYSNEGLKKVLSILVTEKKGDYWVLSHIRMEDLKKNHWTEIKMKNVVFNSGLEKANVFTERFLEAGSK